MRVGTVSKNRVRAFNYVWGYEDHHQKLFWIAANLIIFKWSASSKDGLYALSPIKVSVSSYSAHEFIWFLGSPLNIYGLERRQMLLDCCGCYCPICIYDFCFLFKAIAYFIVRLLAITLHEDDDGITLLHVAHTITSCLCYAQNHMRYKFDLFCKLNDTSDMLFGLLFLMHLFKCCSVLRAVVAAFYATNHVNLSLMACTALLW